MAIEWNNRIHSHFIGMVPVCTTFYETWYKMQTENRPQRRGFSAIALFTVRCVQRDLSLCFPLQKDIRHANPQSAAYDDKEAAQLRYTRYRNRQYFASLSYL